MTFAAGDPDYIQHLNDLEADVATAVADAATAETNAAAAVGAKAPQNLLVNGFPDIWQRGTSFTNHKTTGTSFYGADQWGANRSGDANGVDSSRYTITSADRTAAGRPLGRYGIKWQRTVGNADVGAISIFKAMLTDDSLPLAGQQVTLTIIAKAGANYSGGNLSCQLSYGTGTDQREYSFTGRVQAAVVSATLTANAQVFQCTATLPVTATEVGVRLAWTPTGVAGADDSITILAAIIQYGDGTAHVRPRHRSAEEALCVYTYFRRTFAAGDSFGSGFVLAGTIAYITVPFPVRMRTTPSALEQSGTATDYGVYNGAGSTVCSAVPAFHSRSDDVNGVVSLTVAAGLTTGHGCTGQAATAAAYLGWSADP